MGTLIRICLLTALALVGSACMESDAIRDAREHVDKGHASIAEGDLAMAVTHFRRSVARAPDYLGGRLELARSLVAAGEYLDARKELDYVQQREPENPDALAIWGKALALQGRFDEANGFYTRAISSYGDAPSGVLGEKGMILAAMKQHQEALKLFEQAGESEETDKADILLHWGAALEKADRFLEAVPKYERAMEIAPDEPIILNNLGFVLFRKDIDKERGIELLKRSVALQPGNPMLLHNLGWALLQDGQVEDAHGLLRRAAAATGPKEPTFELRRTHLRQATEQLPRADAGPDMPNVVLIVLDTLRADHLGAYGYPRDTSPNLDDLAGEGVLFKNAFSQAPWTSASIASLLTGLYPSVHGLDEGARWGPGATSAGGKLPFRVQKALTSSQNTLAELLRRQGYTTAGFISNIYVNSIFGFSQGFDLYDDEHKGYSKSVRSIKRRGEETNRRIFRWLDTKPQEPFFLFAHYNDPHWPYVPPAPFGEKFIKGYEGELTPEKTTGVVETQGRPITGLSEEDLRYIIGLYDGEIQYTDHQVGRLVDKLDALAMDRGLLIIVTADHGEEFMDHGSASHGYTLYDEQIHVPLIMRWKGRLPRKVVDGQVRLVDVVPTTLELAGAEAPGPFQGQSLVPAIEGHADAASLFAFAEASYTGRQSTIRSPAGQKLIHDEANEKSMAFDLTTDPAEQNDLWAESWQSYEELSQRLANWGKENLALATELFGDSADEEQIVLDASTTEQLEALGYIE